MSCRSELHYLTGDLNLSIPELEELILSVHGGSPISSKSKFYVDWRMVKQQLKVLFDYKRWMHKKGFHEHDAEIKQVIRVLLQTGSIRDYFRFSRYPVGPDVTINATRILDRRLNRETTSEENLCDLYDLCLPIVEPISPEPQSLFVLARNQLFRSAISYGNVPKSVWEKLEEPLLRKVYVDGEKMSFFTEERLLKFFKKYKESNWSELLEAFFTRVLMNWPHDSKLMDLRDEIILSYEQNINIRKPGWKYGLACASVLRYAFALEKRHFLASNRDIIQYLNILVSYSSLNIDQDSYNHLMIAHRCLLILCEQLDPKQKEFRKEIIEITKVLLIRLAMHSFKADQLYIGRNPFRDAFRELITTATLCLDLDPGNLRPDPPSVWIWASHWYPSRLMLREQFF